MSWRFSGGRRPGPASIPATEFLTVDTVFFRRLRRKCLDWVVVVHRRQLEAVLRENVRHYSAHRPHRSLGLWAPEATPTPLPARRPSPRHVRRHDRLGGLIHEYDLAA